MVCTNAAKTTLGKDGLGNIGKTHAHHTIHTYIHMHPSTHAH
ncbi:hypothetical protein DOY81_000018 [Sarcophaga bullata]|nr:hypothetical protein DOY81_000018 [Sarcophaga bullata]